jgi:hypothetical protein
MQEEGNKINTSNTLDYFEFKMHPTFKKVIFRGKICVIIGKE